MQQFTATALCCISIFIAAPLIIITLSAPAQCVSLRRVERLQNALLLHRKSVTSESRAGASSASTADYDYETEQEEDEEAEAEEELEAALSSGANGQAAGSVANAYDDANDEDEADDYDGEDDDDDDDNVQGRTREGRQLQLRKQLIRRFLGINI